MGKWVFLRGLGREARHWGEFAKQFRQSVGADSFLCLDLPGTGQHHRAKSPLRISEITDFVRQQLPKELSPPFKLLGISLGGMVAIDWALRYRQECQQICVINTSVASLSPFHARLRVPIVREFFQHFRFPSLEGRERIALAHVSNLANERQHILKEWVAIQKEKRVSDKTVARQLLAAATFKPKLSKSLDLPRGLVLVSEQDRMVKPVCSHAIQKATGWDLLSHPWAGHDLPFDDPEWVLNKLLEWDERL